MKKFKKVYRYGGSDNKVYYFTSVQTAERFFNRKPENFNATFSGEAQMCEDDYGYYVDNLEVEKIERGTFTRSHSEKVLFESDLR